jgi:hypothetical protein
MRAAKEPARRSPQHGNRYVPKVNDNDVQLGRGRPVITSEGNVCFRKFNLDKKSEYTSTGLHAQKDEIACCILQTIREWGGRFLRKLGSAEERQLLDLADGVQMWAIVDKEKSLEKVKQALREQNETPGRSREGKSSPARKRTNQDSPRDAGLHSPASSGPEMPALGMQCHPPQEVPPAATAKAARPPVEPCQEYDVQGRPNAPEASGESPT